MLQELTQQVEQLIMPCIAEAGAELVELNIKRRGRTYVVEILADKEAGGITIAECAGINREIFKKCDQSRILGEDFEIAVASPGLDRPLKTTRDFVRNMGRDIRVHLRTPCQERWEYMGTLKEVKNNEVVVETPQGLIELPINQIQKAVQILEID